MRLPNGMYASRSELARNMPSGGVVAEIGVWRGEYAEVIRMQNGPKRLILVDQWLHFDDPSNKNVRDNSQEVINRIYVETCACFSEYPAVTVMRMTSEEAAGMLPDGLFDWVYIDACHEYDEVKRDLSMWWPKIKRGGYMCGHDYVPHVGVVRAVQEFLESEPSAVFAALTRDGSPSYGIQKP